MMAERDIIKAMAQKQELIKQPVNIAELGSRRWKPILKESEITSAEELKGSYVQLTTGELVKNEDYRNLTEEEQKRLNELGIDEFIKASEEKRAEFEKNYIKLGSDEWVSRETYDKLTETEKAKLNELGVEKFSEYNYVKLATGELVRNEDFRNLTEEQKTELNELGIDKFIKLSEERQVEFEKSYIKLGSDEWIAKDIYDKLSDDEKVKLNELGVEKFNEYAKAKAEIEAETEMVSKGYIKIGVDEWVDKKELGKLTQEEQEKLKELGVDGFNKWRGGKYQEEVAKAQAEYTAKVAAVTPKVVPLAQGTGRYSGFKGDYYIRTKNGDMPAWMAIPDTKGQWIWPGASIYDMSVNMQGIIYAFNSPNRYKLKYWTRMGYPWYEYYDEPWTQETWLEHLGMSPEDAEYYIKNHVGMGLPKAVYVGLYDKDGTYIDPVTGQQVNPEGLVNPYGLYDASGKKIRDVETEGYVPYIGGRWPTSVSTANMPSALTSTGIVQRWPEQVSSAMPEIKFPGQWPTVVSSPAVLTAKLSAEELQKQIARGEIIKAKDGTLIPLKVSEEEKVRGIVGFSDLTEDEQYKVRTEGTKGIVEYTVAGEPVSVAYLDKLPEDTRKILVEQGLGAYEYAKVIGGLGEYKNSEGQYNVIDIMRDIQTGKIDITESQLASIFGAETIQQAREYASVSNYIDKYRDPSTGEYNIVQAVEDYRGNQDKALISAIETLFGIDVINEANKYVDAKLAVDPYKDPETNQYNIIKAVKDARENKSLESHLLFLFGQPTFNEAKRLVGYEETLTGFNILGQDFSYKNAKTGEIVGYDIVSALRSNDPQVKEAIRATYDADKIKEATEGKIIEPKNPVDKFNMWLDEVSIRADRDATKGLIYIKDPEAEALVIETKPVGQMSPDEWFDYASERFEKIPIANKVDVLGNFGIWVYKAFTPEERKLYTKGNLDGLKGFIKDLPEIIDPNEFANYSADAYFDPKVKARIEEIWDGLPKTEKERILSAFWPAPDTWQRKILDNLRLEDVAKGITAPIEGTFAPLEDPLWVNDFRLRPLDDPERQAYVKQWKQDAITTGAFVASLLAGGIWAGTGAAAKALTPALIYRLPLGKFIANAAIHLAQVTFAGAPLLRTGSTISEAIQAADIDRKWDVFQMQLVGTQDVWARKAGYDKPFDELNEAQKGHVLLTYSTPDGLSNEEWIKIMGEKLEKMQEYAGKGADWLAERAPHPILAWPVQMIEGAAVGTVEGVGYMAMLPILAAEVVNKVPESSADDMAKQLAAQMTAFATFVIPQAFKERPALTAGRVFGLLVLSPKAAVKLFGAKLAGVSEGHVPKRAMVLEWETFRVQGKRLPTVEDMKLLSDKIVEELITSGKPEIEVSVGGCVGARIRNVPWQQVIGKSMFHGSPERLVTNPDGSVTLKAGEPLYTSPHLAERTLLEAYSGMRGKHPTINVILNAESFKPQVQKILGGKMIEPEHPYGFAEDIILDPVPGMNGKGVTGSSYVGMASIRFWTVRGSGVEWKGLTDIQHAQLKTLAAKESFLDFLLGWNGRRRVWKQMFGKDPKVERLDNSIKEWKHRVTETTEGVNTATIYKGSRFIDDNGVKYEVSSYSFNKTPNGEWRVDIKTRSGKTFKNIPESDMILMSDRARIITRTLGNHNSPISKLRIPIEHPNGGVMRTTVGTIAITADGKIALAIARGHETIPTVPGGGAHYIYYGGKRGGAGVESKQPPNLSDNYGRTYEEMASQTFKEELGLVGDIEHLGKYGGKRNEYSLPGSHIFVMKMKVNQTIDPYRHPVGGEFRLPKDSPIKPELERVWLWDGKTKMEISPSGYDIVKAANIKYKLGYDLSKLEIKSEPNSNHVAKVRDKGFADRVAKNKELTDAELKHFEDLETQWLESARDRLLKGNPIGFKDWLMAETQLGALEELIMGRRKAVSYFNELKSGKTSSGQIANATAQLNKLGQLPPKTQSIVRGKKAGQEFTPDEVKTIVGEVGKTKFEKLVEESAQILPELVEKIEVGVKPEVVSPEITKVKLDTFKDRTEIAIEGQATVVREMTADGMATAGFKLKVRSGADVLVNGEKVSGTVEVKYGDRIQVGNKEVYFMPKEGSPSYFADIIKQFDEAMLKTTEEAKIAEIDKQIKEYQSTLDRLADEHYYENARFYRDRYVNYLDKFSRAAIGQFRDDERYYEDEDIVQEEYEKTYNEERLGQVRPFRTEGAIPWDGRLDTTRKESPSRIISAIPSEVTRYVSPERITEVARIGARETVPRREGAIRPYQPREEIIREEIVYTKPRIGIRPEEPPRRPYEPPRRPVVPPEIPLVPPLIPPPKYTAEYIEKYGLPEGSAAWRQGWVYRHWFPPFGKDDWLFTKTPIREVHYATGPKSAFESIVAVGGPLPDRTLEYDMGLQKLKIVPNVKGTDPGIYFELDRKDASWSPEKVAEREIEEAQEVREAEVQKVERPREEIKPRIAKRQKVEEIEEPEEVEGEPEIEPRIARRQQVIAEEAQPEVPEVQPQRVITQKREIVKETEPETGFEEQAEFEGEASYLDDFVGGWKEQKEVASFMEGFIGEKEEVASQVEETKAPNLISIEMRDWGTSPAYRAIQKTRKRVKQPVNTEEKTGIIMSR